MVAWRLLILGALIYVLFRVVSTLRLVVLPCVAALLLTDLGDTTNDLQRWLVGAPFHLHRAGLTQLSNRLLTFLKQHRSAVAGTVLSGGKIFVAVLAGLVLP